MELPCTTAWVPMSAEETEKASKAESVTEADPPEMSMTVEEWSTEPNFETCSICTGPSEGYNYCSACRKFNNCVDCKDSAIASRHFAEGGCAYEEQWETLGMPTWREVPAPQKRLGDPQTE